MRRVAALVTTVLSIVGLAVGPAHAASAKHGECDYQDTLCAGQSLYTTRRVAWTLRSPDRRFLLYLAGPELWLQETETPPSGRTKSDAVWRVHNVKTDSAREDGTLTMQRNGNLVLRTRKGAVIWSSHTAGTGHDNRLTLRDSGDLVIRTASGRVVWSSHTGRGLLVPGQQLASGERLIKRPGVGALPLRLTMRRDGDLVLQRGSRRAWHTGTRVAGSILRLRTNGRLVVLTPSGNVAWHSPAFGKGSWLRLFGGRLMISKGAECWSRPRGNGCRLG